MGIKQSALWFLTQFYDDPLHTAGQMPVCTSYGSAFGFHCFEGATWGLCLMWTSPPQIDASKQDDRVIFCGMSYSTPPPELLTAYASVLDPAVTYTTMGQVLAKIAESEPMFMHD